MVKTWASANASNKRSVFPSHAMRIIVMIPQYYSVREYEIALYCMACYVTRHVENSKASLVGSQENNIIHVMRMLLSIGIKCDPSIKIVKKKKNEDMPCNQ